MSVYVVFGRDVDNDYTGGGYETITFPPDEYSDFETKINIYDEFINYGKTYPSIKLEKPNYTHENQLKTFGLINDFKYTIEYMSQEPFLFDFISEDTVNYYNDLKKEEYYQMYGYRPSGLDIDVLSLWVRDKYQDYDFYNSYLNYDLKQQEYKIFINLELYRYPVLQFSNDYNGFILSHYEYVIPFDVLFSFKGYLKHNLLDSNDSNFTTFNNNSLGWIMTQPTQDSINLDATFLEDEINIYTINDVIFFNNGYFFFTPVLKTETDLYLKVYFCEFNYPIQSGNSSSSSENNILSELPENKKCCLAECFGITE
jgi:hypothetical protein